MGLRKMQCSRAATSSTSANGGLNTVVQTADGSTRIGVAWFAVSANAKSKGKLDAHVKQQGHASVNGTNVFFPALSASTRRGRP